MWLVIDKRSHRPLGQADSLVDALRGMKEARQAGYNADVVRGRSNPNKGHRIARKRGLESDLGKYCYAVIDYGVDAREKLGFRYGVQCLPERPLNIPAGVEIMAMRMTKDAARALTDHLEAVLRRGNPRFLRRGSRRAFFRVRRRNPMLAVMGGNPPAGDDIEATWAQIEYRRPDDPEGKRIVRVHEFTDGFVATPNDDGSITLKHPRGQNLWTRR